MVIMEVIFAKYSYMIGGFFLKVDLYIGVVVEGVLIFVIIFVVFFIFFKGFCSDLLKIWLLVTVIVVLVMVGFVYIGLVMNFVNVSD